MVPGVGQSALVRGWCDLSSCRGVCGAYDVRK